MAKKKKEKLKSKGKSKPQKAHSPNNSVNPLYYILGILILTFIAFAPSLQNDFVNWDDGANIYENPYVGAFNFENIKAIFTTDIIGGYNPLTTFSFLIEKAIFDLDPFWVHLNNILLHLICVFLVFKIIRLLGFSIQAAAIATLLFAIHPMKVESVTWATERKDVLFGAFYLAGIYYYLKYQLVAKHKKYLIYITIFFILSLFSKIQAVAFPLSLLCIDYFIKRPLKAKLIFEKAHYFLLSAGVGFLGIYILSQAGTISEENNNFSLIQRMSIGAYSYIMYWIKFLVPFKLSPLYPYPEVLPLYITLAPIAIIGVLTLIWYAFKRGNRALVFGILFFSVNVVFVLQIIGAGQGFLADRFTYIPYLGISFIIAYLLDQWLLKKYSFPSMIGFGLLILAFVGMTFQQSKIWKNSETLWTHVIKYYPNISTAYKNRGLHFQSTNELNKALPDFTKTLELNPTESDIWNDRGNIYFTGGNNDLAIADYLKAIENDPTVGGYYVNLGTAYGAKQMYPQALAQFNKGLELDENQPKGYLNRSLVYRFQNKLSESTSDLSRYLEMDDSNPDLFYERARMQRQLNQIPKAIEDINQAISRSNKGIYLIERARIFIAQNQLVKARKDLSDAQQLGATIPAELIGI